MRLTVERTSLGASKVQRSPCGVWTALILGRQRQHLRVFYGRLQLARRQEDDLRH